MRKWIATGAAALFLAFTVSGCGGIDEKALPAEARVINYDAITADEVLQRVESFRLFTRNMSEGTADWIRVVSHTAEGDPVFGDVKYDGKRVEFTIDTTQDKWSSKQKIEKFTCDPELTKETDANGLITYNFTDCDNEGGIATLYTDRASAE